MIKKILFVAIVLLVAYNFLVQRFPLQKEVFYDNEERAEEYIHSKRDYTTVSVGSSLIGGFKKEMIAPGQDYFNLFFPYSGSCTGVELIVNCGKAPDILLVEINHLDRGINKELVHEVFHPLMYRVKHLLPALMKKNQLFTYLLDSFKPPQVESSNETPPPPELYQKLLATARKEWHQMSDTIQFQNYLLQLRNNIRTLSRRHTKVVFFEMPIDSSLIHSVKAKYQRSVIQKAFAEPQYQWIHLDTSNTYHTGDGVHLLRKDMEKYMNYLSTELKKRMR